MSASEVFLRSRYINFLIIIIIVIKQCSPLIMNYTDYR